ncbi:MAG: hypothetical protein WD942_00990, partial [Dehalococcoidia bacterium]
GPELWVGWVSGPSQQRSARVIAPEAKGSLPELVVHADWGSNPRKRWMCVAERTEDGYRVSAPEQVGDPEVLLARLRDRADGGAVLVGFDFPLGLPAAYARNAGIERFREVLPELGQGRWDRFFDVAERADEIGLERPFYPSGSEKGSKQQYLIDALGVRSIDDLLRICERANGMRGPASSLFWTLGPKQVGKAAILGWKQVLLPAIAHGDLPVWLWPFDGVLQELIAKGGIVVAETYPAEACLHLGITPPGRGWAKTLQKGRRAQAPAIRGWLERRDVEFARDLVALIDDGFGAGSDAEDPFDALLGLMSMLEVSLGHRSEGAPQDAVIRTVEGWILGQAGDVR